MARLCEAWYPKICEAFRSDDYKPTTYVTLVLSNSYKGVAMAGGGRITGSVKFFKDHPDDRRVYIIEITAAGRKMLTALQKIADEMERKLLAEFSATERKLIRRALLTLAG